MPLRTNRGKNVRQVVARLRCMVVGARLGNVDLLAGGVAVPVLYTRVGDARVGEDDILFPFYKLPLVCFKEGAILVTVYSGLVRPMPSDLNSLGVG